MKLDLGCGRLKLEGYIGVDSAPIPEVDVVHDLTIVPWPFADVSVDAVHSSHFFEHLTAPQRIAMMHELHRIMKPGAEARIVTPYWNSVGAIQDPTHQWPPIAEQSYFYFNADWRERAGLAHYGIHCDFDLRFSYDLEPRFRTLSEPEIRHAIRHVPNAVIDLIAILIRR
jgi:hypothetical protein